MTWGSTGMARDRVEALVRQLFEALGSGHVNM
jgi:hypothetical protein